jgi:cell wall-associated NlpC family hydrolase
MANNSTPTPNILQAVKPSAVSTLAVQYANEAVAGKNVPYTLGGMQGGPIGQSTAGWSVQSTLLTKNIYNPVIGGKVGCDCVGLVRYSYGRAWGIDKFGGASTWAQASMPIELNYWPVYKGVDPATVTDNKRFELYKAGKLIVDYPATIAKLTIGDIIYWTWKRDSPHYAFPQINNSTNQHASIYVGRVKTSDYNLVGPCVANGFSASVFPGVRNTIVSSDDMGLDVLAIKRILQ